MRDRRQDRARPGVHDLRLPARLDRARVRDRRPRDADRLRPRRRRGRAADPRAGHLQARRERRRNCWIGYGACILRGATSATTASSAPTPSSPRTCRPTRSRPAPRTRPAHARDAGDAAVEVSDADIERTILELLELEDDRSVGCRARPAASGAAVTTRRARLSRRARGPGRAARRARARRVLLGLGGLGGVARPPIASQVSGRTGTCRSTGRWARPPSGRRRTRTRRSWRGGSGVRRSARRQRAAPVGAVRPSALERRGSDDAVGLQPVVSSGSA